MPLDIQRAIDEFLANPNNRAGLTRAGIGAGVGAAGLGLVDAFADSEEDRKPKDKAKSVLKSMLLGGVLGGAGGAGIHSISQMARDPNIAPNGAQYYPAGIRKGYAQLRAGMGTNDREADNWAAERTGGVLGALGGIGREFRDWKHDGGEKGFISKLTEGKVTPDLKLNNALGGTGRISPALEAALRQFVGQNPTIPTAAVEAAFNARGVEPTFLSRLSAGTQNTYDTAKDMFQRNTNTKNWVDAANAPTGRAAPGWGTGSEMNNRLRSWFGVRGPTVEAEALAARSGAAMQTQNALNEAYNTANPTLPQRTITPLTKPEQLAIGRGGNFRPDVRGGTWIPQPGLPPLVPPSPASTDILNGPRPSVNAGAVYAGTPLSRVLANQAGPLANPWARRGARVGGGAALGIAAGYAADLTARNTLDRWLMNPDAKPFVR